MNNMKCRTLTKKNKTNLAIKKIIRLKIRIDIRMNRIKYTTLIR